MIRWFENPIFAKTVQVENRKLGTGPQAWLRRYGVAWLIWLLPMGLISLFSLENVLRNPAEVVWVFQLSLKISAFFMLLHCVSKAVHGTLNGISLEKEQKTYESLQATLLSPSEIVGGKLLTGLWPTLREIAATFPITVIMGLAGGCLVPALGSVVVTLGSAMVLSCIGLMCSYRAATTQAATQQSSVWVAGLLFAFPLLAALSQTSVFYLLSPFGAFFDLFSERHLSWAVNPLPYAGLCLVLLVLLWDRLCGLERQARRVK